MQSSKILKSSYSSEFSHLTAGTNTHLVDNLYSNNLLNIEINFIIRIHLIYLIHYTNSNHLMNENEIHLLCGTYKHLTDETNIHLFDGPNSNPSEVEICSVCTTYSHLSDDIFTVTIHWVLRFILSIEFIVTQLM